MVEFGEYLLSFQNPEWKEYYLNYELLKELLYKIAKVLVAKGLISAKLSKEESNGTSLKAAQSAPIVLRASMKQSDLPEGKLFEEQIDRELEKINSFYLQKKDEFGKEVALLEDLVRLSGNRVEEKEELKLRFHALWCDLHLMRDFASLNYTGFSKILKKHDKECPIFKMKVNYIKTKVNQKPVFGILDSLYRYQAQTLQLYADVFTDGNRIEAEMALETAFARDFEARRKKDKTSKPKRVTRSSSTYAIDADSLVIPRDTKKKKEEISAGALTYQKARLSIMSYIGHNSQETIMGILFSLFLIFFGGCAQSLTLEYIVHRDPGCGSTITFFQFLCVALSGARQYFVRNEDRKGLLGYLLPFRLKPRKIPLKYHVACVSLSWLAAVVAAAAYNYKISVPLHMIVKSSILLVNMCIGVLLLGRRYSLGEVISVVVLTVGVLLSTLASLPPGAQWNDFSFSSSSDLSTWLLGLIILGSSIICTGLLGVLQDFSYNKYGKHWEEIMFYAHFLGLILFVTVAPDIINHASIWTGQMWLFLFFNAVTSFIAIRGTYELISLTSSLTGTLTITVRKFFVLILSVLLFKNDFTWVNWLGATLVLVGSILYTLYSARAAAEASKKAQEEKAKAKELKQQ